MAQEQSDLTALYALQKDLRQKQVSLQSDITVAQARGDQDTLDFLSALMTNIDQRLQEITHKIETASTADAAMDSLESIASQLGDKLEAVKKSTSDLRAVSALESEISALAAISNRTIQQMKAASLGSGFEPRLTVLRPSVKLVDANLAYKYADLQSDANTLVGLTTLFLGTGFASGLSLGLSLSSTPVQQNIIAIHSVATIMSLLVSALFAYLAWRARKRANEVRRLLEAEVGQKEISLHTISAPGSDTSGTS